MLLRARVRSMLARFKNAEVTHCYQLLARVDRTGFFVLPSR